MIEEKYLELINAEIDGELPESQRADLSRYLLANPEARALRDDLRRLCTALDGMERVAPPPGLRESVLRALPRVALGRPAGWSAFRDSVPLRYAAGLAGVLLVGTLAYQFGVGSRDGLRVTDLAGTMAGTGHSREPVRADMARVDLAEVRGVVNLYDAGPALVVEFDLAPRQDIDIVVAYDGHEARFTEPAASDANGRRRYALSLEKGGEVGSVVDVRFLASGLLIHEATLEPVGAR